MSQDDGNTKDTWMHDALQREDWDAVRQRVLNEPDFVSAHDCMGNTPLLAAINVDCLELVEFLLQHGADPNVAVADGYTALLTAIESQMPASKEIVDRLIAAGADIHFLGVNGWSPLHMAAARGELDKARRLVAAGVAIDQRKEIDGEETPLMEAAYAGHPQMVRYLLDCGADPTLQDSINNNTPLEIARAAAQGADQEVYEYLKKENFKLDPEELFSDAELPSDQLEFVESLLENVDLAESYRQNADQLARDGDHAGVIQILTEHAQA